ncbi:hypothetical protein MAH1_31600 [Sessilibacter sp. MAH1]
MIVSAIDSPRDKPLYLFVIGVIGCFLLTILLISLIFYAVNVSNEIKLNIKLNLTLVEKLQNLDSNQSGNIDVDLINLLAEYRVIINDLYNPSFYLFEIERHKSNEIKFESLEYLRSDGVISAVVSSRDDLVVTKFLNDLETSEVFKSVKLNKKDLDKKGEFHYNFNLYI